MNTTAYQPPRYKHDCTNCHYLGHEKHVDLYFCKGPYTATVIGRVGDEGPDYGSGIELSYTNVGPLYEARQRAQEQGLVAHDLKMAAFYLRPDSPQQLRDEFLKHLDASTIGRAMVTLASDEENGAAAIERYMQSRIDELHARFPDKCKDDELSEWVRSEMTSLQNAADIVGRTVPRWPYLLAVNSFKAH